MEDETRQTRTYLRATKGQSLHAAVMTSTQTQRTMLSPRGLWPSGDMVTWCRERDGDRSSVPDTAPALGSSLVAAVGTVTRTQLLPAQQTPRRPIEKMGAQQHVRAQTKLVHRLTQVHIVWPKITQVHTGTPHRYTQVHRYIQVYTGTYVYTDRQRGPTHMVYTRSTQGLHKVHTRNPTPSLGEAARPHRRLDLFMNAAEGRA